MKQLEEIKILKQNAFEKDINDELLFKKINKMSLFDNFN